MLSSELEGQVVDVDVPGAPPVRIRASVILGAMGLDPARYGAAFAALFAIGAVLVLVTAFVVGLQMRSLCRCWAATSGCSVCSEASMANSEAGTTITPTALHFDAVIDANDVTSSYRLSLGCRTPSSSIRLSLIHI